LERSWPQAYWRIWRTGPDLRGKEMVREDGERNDRAAGEDAVNSLQGGRRSG